MTDSALQRCLLSSEARLQEVLNARPESQEEYDFLKRVAAHLCFASKARRFRPMLVAVCGLQVKLREPELVSLACAAEMIHAASLLHDDVVDGGTERRGQPTANVRFGNTAAVLTGDWLLTQALQQLDALPIFVTRSAVRVITQMSRAALIEAQSRGRILPLSDWKSMAEGKTGMLFGWCASAPVSLTSASDWVGQLEGFGRRLGLAFQLADDLRDFTASDSGKKRWTDLSTQNPSAVITLAALRDPALGRALEEAWRTETWLEIPHWADAIEATGALDAARTWLQEEVDAALHELPNADWKFAVNEFFQSLMATLEPSR